VGKTIIHFQVNQLWWKVAPNSQQLMALWDASVLYRDTKPENSLETQIQTMVEKRAPSECKHTSQAAIIAPWSPSRKWGNSSRAALHICDKWLLSNSHWDASPLHLPCSDTPLRALLKQPLCCYLRTEFPQEDWCSYPGAAHKVYPSQSWWHSTLINVCDLSTLLSSWVLSGVNNSTI